MKCAGDSHKRCCPRLEKKLPKREEQEEPILAEYLAQAPGRLVDLFPAVLVLLVEVKYHQCRVDLPHGHLIGCQRSAKRSRDVRVRKGKGSGEGKNKSKKHKK